MASSSFHIRGFHLGLQPAPAWTVILGFILFSALCILLHVGSIIRVGFPLGAFAVSVFLYCRYPILYLGFTWWLWFLTPWVRRLIDYQSGWVDPNPVLLAPFLAVLVTLATFLRHLPKFYRQDGLPFALAFIGVFYGFLIGLVNSTVGDVSTLSGIALSGMTLPDGFRYTLSTLIVTTLNWLTPIIFGFHLLINWQDYPKYRQNIQRAFRWGVLLTGAYGVLQYLIAPEWDRLWLTNAIEKGVGQAFGTPEPLGIRVFSTMNSSGPFAVVLMTGLLLLLADKGTLRLFALVVGFLSFLLTLVRAAWGGWFLGILIFVSSLKTHLQMRLIITLLVIGTCAFPLTTMEPFSKVINNRLQTLSSVQEDGSYQARAEVYDKTLGVSLLQPLGNGLGLPGADSSFIDLFLALGWLGGIPYLGGIILLFLKLSQCNERRFDRFVSAASAISFTLLVMLFFGNGLTGVSGLIFWSFPSIVIAAHKYYQKQRAIRLESN